MPRNYLIGIGGTGARVIESVVHLCAAGFGPDSLSIFLVDPDAANGNLTRTKKLINNYLRCQKNLQKSERTKIFKTEIKIPPGEKGLVWEIFSDKDATLAKYINYSNMCKKNKVLADFTSLLFTNTELDTELDEGFRGHPSIGSVVMSNPPQKTYPFKMLFDDLAGNAGPNDIRVFLVGSVFGGTGAAGFPTLGSRNILKYHPNAKIGDDQSKILLGGALVLPYFSFDLNVNPKENMFVTTNDFPIATKAALQYYNDKDLGVDQIYFIGDSLSQKVGKFGVGAKKQENLPHYVEVASSLAAFDFYNQPDIEGVPERMLFTSMRESNNIKWSDLPISRNPERIRQYQMQLKTSLTNFTVFAYTMLTYGRLILDSQHKSINESWYKDVFKFKEKREKDKDKDPRQLHNKEVLDDYESFLNKFLFWISALDDNSGYVELIDKKMLLEENLIAGTNPKRTDPINGKTIDNIG